MSQGACQVCQVGSREHERDLYCFKKSVVHCFHALIAGLHMPASYTDEVLLNTPLKSATPSINQDLEGGMPETCSTTKLLRRLGPCLKQTAGLLLAASVLVVEELGGWACLGPASVLVAEELGSAYLGPASVLVAEAFVWAYLVPASALAAEELGWWTCLGPASFATLVVVEACCPAVRCLAAGKRSGSRMAKPAHRYVWFTSSSETCPRRRRRRRAFAFGSASE